MRRVRRFFKTPKGLTTVILLILTGIAAPGEGVRTVAIGIGAAVLAAGLIDVNIIRVRKRVCEYPSGAVLTA